MPIRTVFDLAALLGALVLATVHAGAAQSAVAGGYVIATTLDPSDEYYAAVRRLNEHRKPRAIITFKREQMRPLFEQLSVIAPEHVAFVMRPGDIDVNLQYEILERAGALDDDPFLDFKYGFITGKTAGHALALVENTIKAERAKDGHPRRGMDFGPVEQKEDKLESTTRKWHGDFSMRTLRHSTRGFPDAHKDVFKGEGLVRYWGHGMPERVCDGLTAAQVGKMDTFPAVFFGGACYTGVCGGTYDKSLRAETVKGRVIEPEQSFCLNLLASGCTGFFGALDPDHGITAGQEMQHLMETGCDLGEAMAYSYRLITLCGGDLNGKFYRLEDGKPQPPKRGEGANKYFEIMRHGAACRVLFGDPAFKPYAAPIIKPMFETSIDASMLRVKLNDGDWYHLVDIFHCDERGHMAQKFYGVTELAPSTEVKDVQPVRIEAGGRDLGAPLYFVWKVEQRAGKRLLHVQADLSNRTPLLSVAGKNTFAEFKLVAGAAKAPEDHTTSATPGGGYVVAVEDGAGEEWKAVGERLRAHRQGTLINFKPGDLKSLIPELRRLRARNLALVMRPGTLDANIPRLLVPLLTTIDDDPFVDVAFGVITGADAKDAMKLVENTIRAEKVGVPERGIGIHAGVVKKCVEYAEAKHMHSAPHRPFTFRQHYVYGDDPDWKQWWSRRRERLAGNGLIDIGSCGDSQGIWLFDAGRNGQRDKHWKYDPAKVGHDPKGEMPRLTPEILFGGATGPDIFPAVVINGSCHSAVTSRTVVWSDIVSTFGSTDGKVVFHEIKPEESFPLQAIAHGATAYIGPLGANHASRSSIEINYLLTMGASLGEVMKRCYDELVMGADDRGISVPALVEGAEIPRDEGWVMWVDTLHRVVIGDPAFAPFAKPAPDTQRSEARLEGGKLTVTLTVDQPANNPRIWDPWTKVRGNSSRLLELVKLEQPLKAVREARIVEAKVQRKGEWQDVKLSVSAALEQTDGASVLHLKAGGAREDLEQDWSRDAEGKYSLKRPRPEAIRVVFEVAVEPAEPRVVTPAPTGAGFKPEKMWDMPLKGAAFGSAAVGDLDGDGRPEIVFGCYFGESKTYCLDGKTGKEKWSYKVKRGPIDDSVVIADVTGDGKPEVLFAGSASGEIVCLDGAGKTVWHVDDDIAGETFDGAIAVGDMDGDGTKEILIASALRQTNEGVLYCRQGATGKLVWQQKLKGWIQNSVTLVDIDGDKLDDCVVGTWRGDNTVQAFRGKDGKHLWTYQAGGWMYHCPSVGDTDGDGVVELAIGGYDKRLHVISLKGERVRVIDVGENILAPTTMHDIDGDGNLEVIVTTCGGNAIAYDGKGKQVWKTQVGKGCVWRGAVVAEVDGKPGVELLIQPDDECALVALNPADGRELWRISIAEYNTPERTYRTSSAAVVDDFDGDGRNDVFFTGSGDLQVQHGVAVCYRGAGVGQKWTTLHGGLRHHNRAPASATADSRR